MMIDAKEMAEAKQCRRSVRLLFLELSWTVCVHTVIR